MLICKDNEKLLTRSFDEIVGEMIQNAYDDGFKAGQEHVCEVDSDKFIEQGRNEAWEAAKKLSDAKNVNEILDDTIFYCVNIFERYTASEAIEKLRTYEEQKQQEEASKICVGDEVVTTAGDNGAVIGVSENDVVLFTSEWYTPQVVNKTYCKRTGRTFPEIAEVLKKLKGSE